MLPTIQSASHRHAPPTKDHLWRNARFRPARPAGVLLGLPLQPSGQAWVGWCRSLVRQRQAVRFGAAILSASVARIFARTFRQRGWARSGKPKGGLRFRNRNHQHSFGLADGPTPLPLEGPETVALAPRSIRATVFLAIPEKASNITPGWFRGSPSCVPRHQSRPIGWSKTPTL